MLTSRFLGPPLALFSWIWLAIGKKKEITKISHDTKAGPMIHDMIQKEVVEVKGLYAKVGMQRNTKLGPVILP